MQSHKSMNRVDVTAFEIRDFARSLGWNIVREAVLDGLFVLNSPDKDGTQLIFPKETSDDKFDEAATVTINRLAEFYKTDYIRILECIREVYDDVFYLRYYSDVKNINFLLFENALKTIEAARQIILSAASSVVHPSIYHPKLTRTEPLELIRKTKFRHTQEGSFVLKISCPIELQSGGVHLFGEDYSTPFGRKTFSLINESALELLNTIESNNEERFIEEQLKSENPIISYNFCDAMSNMFDENVGLPFELLFNWSRHSLNKIPTPKLNQRVRYQYEYKNKIDDIKVYFKSESLPLKETFIATVESLNGDTGEDGRRFGDVRLNILIGSSVVTAKVTLNAEQYLIAHESHITQGSYIMVSGTLLPGKLVRVLDSITDFKIIG